MNPTTPARQFRSCLLVAPSDAETWPCVRALHSAGIAVLERAPSATTINLATSGEFDLVAWLCGPSSDSASAALQVIASRGVPVIALLENVTAAAASECLMAGADACLQLDADPRLVVAQAHAVLRRRYAAEGVGAAGAAGAVECGVLQVGDLTVDVDRCEVERAGEFVALTAAEFRIVAYMARNAGRVLRPHEILNAVSEEYEYRPREAQEVFKVYVRRIRRKLEPNEGEPRYLVTARGFGYRLEGGANRPARPASHTMTG